MILLILAQFLEPNFVDISPFEPVGRKCWMKNVT